SQVVVAATAKPGFALTVFGDSVPCVLLVLAILVARENFRNSAGILPVFWKLFTVGLVLFLGSQVYWFYYDWRGLKSAPSAITGDTLFLAAHIAFLSALALRPHSAAAGRNLRFRFLDLILLSVWWLSLYGYFSLPWEFGHQDLSQYTPSYYLLALIQHLVIISALTVLMARNSPPWRTFYMQLLVAFGCLAAGNLLLNLAIDTEKYYAGSFYDTPFVFAIYLFVSIAGFGRFLQPRPDSKPNRELIQSMWTARLAMLGILSLPAIAFLGLYENGVPSDVANFRLRLVFGAMFFLGGLIYWKFNLLSRELSHLVQLTSDSINNLNTVQKQVTHSEKLIALGRLAAGAAHEISNPLTAIFGYSELLTDLPSLTTDDRAKAQLIQQQVHQAQAAVNSLRNSLRQNPSPAMLIDKKPAS
ncbi:MAG: histidine kinase dimerization/phospho-acceptor domain-containing protein, partial [Candidatus Acidiferrum sp.]